MVDSKANGGPYPVSDHYDGTHFSNQTKTELRGLIDVLRWKMAGGEKTWGPQPTAPKPQLPKSVGRGDVYVTSIGHITHLIQTPSMTILTDPVFSLRASPLKFAGPKRVQPPALEISELPPIDLVLVSHNHYDHMDLESLKELNQRFKPRFVVPLANARFLQAVGITNVREFDWWQKTENVTIVPAQHWSSRTPFDRNKALWCGFVLSVDGHQIYFAGDSGYGPHFKEIREKLGPMDVSILPIGAYEPRWFMKDQHMNPDDAVRAHLDLESKFSIGTHFGTFQLTDEGITEPAEKLRESLLSRNVDAKVFIAPAIGDVVHVHQAPGANQR